MEQQDNWIKSTETTSITQCRLQL